MPNYLPYDFRKNKSTAHSDIYNPTDVPEMMSRQKQERKIIPFTCPLCGKQSLFLFYNKRYLECVNIKCKAIGVPTTDMTKITIDGRDINVFPPEGFRRN
jgi:hypothetical protein